MLIPRYSIRSIFLIMAGCAVLFLLIGLGLRGHAWAGATAVGIGSLLLVMLVHAALFSLCWIVAGRIPIRKPARATAAGLAAGGSSGTPPTSPPGHHLETPIGKDVP